MPRRTLTATLIWVHKRNKPDDMVNLTKIGADKSDYLHLFHGFAKEVNEQHLHDQANEKWTKVLTVAPGGRAVLVAVQVGSYGEKGSAVNTSTGLKEFDYEEHHAIQVTTHGLLVVPPSGRKALLFQERAGNRSGAGRVHDVFIKEFQKKFSDCVVKTQPVLESEAWLAAAQLKAVHVGVTRPSSDEAEFDVPGLKDVGYEYSIVPRGIEKMLPRKLYDYLKSGKIRPGDLVHLTSEAQADTVSVTMSKDGRQKTFELGHEKEPFASILLTNHGDAPPTAGRVRERSLDEAKEYFERVGEEWSEQYAAGPWSQEQVNVRTVVPTNGEQT